MKSVIILIWFRKLKLVVLFLAIPQFWLHLKNWGVIFIYMAMLKVGLRAHLFCISQISQCLISAQPSICLCLAIRISFVSSYLVLSPGLIKLLRYVTVYLPHICLFFCNAATSSTLQSLRVLVCYFFSIRVVPRMGQVLSGTCVWGGVSQGRQGEDKMDRASNHGSYPAERVWIYKNRLIVLQLRCLSR